MGYTPAFDSIYDGTLYGRWPTAAVWATLIPLIDKRGEINRSYEAIAGMTGWPMDLLRQGISELQRPDPGSRTPAEDGRRLVPLDPARPWGWRVVNHGVYREKARKMAYDAERTASGADAQRKRVSRDVPTRPDASRDVPLSDSRLQTPDADSNEEGRGRSRSRKALPTPLRGSRLPADFELTSDRRQIAEAEALDADRVFAGFCDYWRSAAGAKARKCDWDATWRNWCRTEAGRPRARGSTNGQPLRLMTAEEAEARERGGA